MSYICRGIPGGSGSHKVSDPDDLIAGICEACVHLLTSAKSWGSAAPVAAKANGKGSPIVINEKKHVVKSRRKAAGLAVWRDYPDGK